MESDELISNFWRANKHKYSHLDINVKDAIDLCRAPFVQLKVELAKGSMKDTRMPFLGVFAVRNRRLSNSIVKYHKRVAAGTMSQETFNTYLDMFERRLSIAWPSFEKYQDGFKHLINLEKYNGIIHNGGTAGDTEPGDTSD